MKHKYIQHTRHLVYRRLLKAYPKGMTFSEMEMATPKSLRRYLSEALQLLTNEGILERRLREFYLINSICS